MQAYKDNVILPDLKIRSVGPLGTYTERERERVYVYVYVYIVVYIHMYVHTICIIIINSMICLLFCIVL